LSAFPEKGGHGPPRLSAIARLEAGNTEPTIPTLRRYAEATGKKLRIELAG
jgi:hypothetical protein